MPNERLGSNEQLTAAEHLVGKRAMRAIRWAFKHGPWLAGGAYVASSWHDHIQRNGVKPRPPMETLRDISEYEPEATSSPETDLAEEDSRV